MTEKHFDSQLTLFDLVNMQTDSELNNNTENANFEISEQITKKMKTYRLEEYIEDIENNGLAETWNIICEYILKFGESNDFLNINNFGEMYEIGLALQDKKLKKKNGQYYTPDDVALVMSKWFDLSKGDNICDVACGTGKLILTYLDYVGFNKARSLLESGKIFLYDIDETALKICETIILTKYGTDLKNKLNIINNDFLNESVVLPDNCKTIANPPYASIRENGYNWKETNVLTDTGELYAVFMEKIITQSKSTVIITPFSFISGKNFYSLRKVLNNYNGNIFSFDNVPGNIFCGRKHGIFNSNTSNSVRAAITVVNSDNDNGFRLTPLIRFKSTERSRLLKCDVLENFLSPHYQKITNSEKSYYKCFKELQPLYDCLKSKSNNHCLGELISQNGEYIISMPNTCRYYTTASADILKRNGQIIMNFDNKEIFNYVFCLINSSFAYWHWRLFDGGITYPSGLLMKLPTIYHLLTDDDHLFFEEVTREMIYHAEEYLITKNNIGIQENIKYPKIYRDKINQRFLKILNTDIPVSTFDLIHSNIALR